MFFHLKKKNTVLQKINNRISTTYAEKPMIAGIIFWIFNNLTEFFNSKNRIKKEIKIENNEIKEDIKMDQVDLKENDSPGPDNNSIQIEIEQDIPSPNPPETENVGEEMTQKK